MTSAGVAGNIQAAFLDAGKKYIVSTGGANGAFTCGSDANFDKFISTYYSANLIGIDFDIEGGVNQAQITELVKRVNLQFKLMLIIYITDGCVRIYSHYLIQFNNKFCSSFRRITLL